MASPLLQYANSYVITMAEGEVELLNGRFVAGAGDIYLVKCFIKRSQYTGVSSGSKKLPLESQLDGEMMPGASGDSFYYRGYALQYAVVESGWNPLSDDNDSLSWVNIETQPEWLLPGTVVDFYFGQDPVILGKIERSSGVFGGSGIDEIVYKELGGVQIQITGGDLQR